MKSFIIWILVIAFIAFFFNTGSSGRSSNFNDNDSYSGESYSEDHLISKADAIDGYWDEISEYVNGTETIEACSDESGNCYDLDADISSGHLETLHFPNGGYLNFSTPFDSAGNASDSDDEGRGWTFTLDMDSSMVDDAISDWASDNDHTID